VKDVYGIYSLISRTFLHGIWHVFCLRLTHTTYPDGQSFRMTYHQIYLEDCMIQKSLTKCSISNSLDVTENDISGQMFTTTPMTQMKKMKMTPTTIYRTHRQNSFFWRRRFPRFWILKLTFIAFACKNHYFVVNWSRRIFTGEKVNWPVTYSWITLDSRYVAKISAAAFLRMQLISEYMR